MPSDSHNIVKWTIELIKNENMHKNGVIIGIASKDTNINGDVCEDTNNAPSYFFASARQQQVYLALVMLKIITMEIH